MRRARRLLRPGAVVCGVWLLAFAAQAEPKPLGTWYAMSVIQASGLMTVTHYWSKEGLFRSVTVINGVPVITLVNATTYTTIDGLNQVGLSIDRSPKAIAEDAIRRRPFASEFEHLVSSGGEKIRMQAVGGAMTEVWRATDEEGQITVWVMANEPRVPIRVEKFDRKTGNTGQLAYVNWLVDLPIPDAFFEPWEGLQLGHITYEQYQRARIRGPVGPAPPLFSDLLNGKLAN